MKLVLPASHHTPFPIHPLSVREVPNDASLLAIMSDIVDDGAREKVQESGLQATEGLAETTTFNLQTSEEDCVPTSESVTSNPMNSNSYTDMMLPASNLRSSRYRFPNGWSSLVPTSTIATNTKSSCSSSSSSSSNSSSDTTAMHMHTNVLLPVGTNLYAEHHQCKKQLQEVSRELDELKLSFEKMKKEKLELQARLEEMNYYQKEKIHDLTGENLKLKLQLKRAEIQQLQQQKTSSGTNGTNKTAAASANVKSFSTLTPTNSNHSSSSINAAMSKSLTANRALSQGSSTSMGSKNPITTTSSKNNNNSSSSNNIPMSTSIVSNVDSVNSNNNNDGIDQHQVSSKSSSNSSDVVPSLSSSSLATNIAVISTSTEEAEKDKEDASIPKINPFAPLSSPFLSTANNETTMAAVPPSLSSSVNPFASFTNSFLSNLGSKSIFQAATSSVGLPAAVDKPATSSSSTIAGTLATSLAAASSILPPTTATSQGQASEAASKKKTMAQTTVKVIEAPNNNSNNKKRKASSISNTTIEASKPSTTIDSRKTTTKSLTADIESLKAKLKKSKSLLSPTASTTPLLPEFPETAVSEGSTIIDVNSSSTTSSASTTNNEISGQVSKKMKMDGSIVVKDEVEVAQISSDPSAATNVGTNLESLKAKLKRKPALNNIPDTSATLPSEIVPLSPQAAQHSSSSQPQDFLTTNAPSTSLNENAASMVSEVAQSTDTANSKFAAMKAKLTKKK